MFFAKKKPSAGASKLLRTAVADMSLYSSSQPILLSKLACCLPTLIRIRRGQTEREPSLADFKLYAARVWVCVGLTALAGVGCGIGGQPVLEVGVVGANIDQRLFLVKPYIGVFFCLVSPVLMQAPFCASVTQ